MYSSPVIFLVLVSTFFSWVNFVYYLIHGKLKTRKKIWVAIELFTVIMLPVFFLFYMDFGKVNDCCTESAVFSPNHRLSIYLLMLLSMLSYLVSVFRKTVFPPFLEVLLNSFLILGLILNVIFCKHFTSSGESSIWVVFGNVPIILLFFLKLAENQRMLEEYIDENDLKVENALGSFCLRILKLKLVYRISALTLLLIPLIIIVSLFLLLFGQKPDSLLRAFTDTYKHGFSQLDYECKNIECGGHFLCSVGANGHKNIVKPIRYGERRGSKIICTRQLLISNAFEELLEEKCPKLHRVLRNNYNRVGEVIHRHYHVFHNKFVSDFVYLLMKPLELLFLMALYIFDMKPENRIASQYLNPNDIQKIKAY